MVEGISYGSTGGGSSGATTPVTTSTSSPVSTTTPAVAHEHPSIPSIGLPSSASSASLIRLVNDHGTFYVIVNGQRYGVTDPGILNSYGLNFKDATAATAPDLALGVAANLPPASGSLVKTADPTVYLISGRQRYGFVSSKVFTGLGYKFSSVLTVTGGA